MSTIEVPATHLDSLREAVWAEIDYDIRCIHEALTADGYTRETRIEDIRGSLTFLNGALAIWDQLPDDANEPTKLVVDPRAMEGTLHYLGEALAVEAKELFNVAPVDCNAVAKTADGLNWVHAQAEILEGKAVTVA